MALIFSSDFDSLPTDPANRWVKLRDLVEKRLGSIVDTQEGATDQDLIEYCSILSSAADELGVGTLPNVASAAVRRDFSDFRSKVIALATQLSLRSSTSSQALSVALVRPTRAKISAQIERLRKLVSGSDLPSDRKKKLADKLDELEALMRAPRTDFAKVMALLAYLATGLGGTTAFLAEAPDALATITALIGQDKAEEEIEEQQLLEAEKRPLGLPAPESRADDPNEIPF